MNTPQPWHALFNFDLYVIIYCLIKYSSQLAKIEVDGDMAMVPQNLQTEKISPHKYTLILYIHVGVRYRMS